MPLTYSRERARKTRKLLIDIASRRQKPGSGSLDLNPRKEPWLNWPDLTPVLGDIPWATVGAVATRLYMPERVTADIDVVIAADRAADARGRLRAGGYTFEGDLSIGGSGWSSPDGLHLDVIEGTEAWWQQAISEAQGNRDQEGLPTLPLPYLVLMKLQVSRFQDVTDVGRMLAVASDDALRQVREVVDRYSPELGDDLSSIIALGKLETQSGNP